MAVLAPVIGQQLVLSSRIGRIQPCRARVSGCVLRSAGFASARSPARLRISAAIENVDNAGGGLAGSPSFAAPEGVDISSVEDVTAKGSVGVVEAMTGKTVDLNAAETEFVDTGGIGGDGDVGRGGGGGGGGGGGDEDQGKKGGKALSMSQKLTLVYAALVGVGGLMGFLKSGSTKSLFSGGIAAVSLLAVYSQLPANPVGASVLGAGISVVLLLVMGSRFRGSGKFFPAGLVSLVSLVMSGGYVHGILRSKH